MTPDQFVWWLRGFMSGGSTDMAAIRTALASVPLPAAATPPPLVLPPTAERQRALDEVKRRIAEQDRWPSIPPLQPRILDAPYPSGINDVTCVSGKAA